LSPHPPFEKRLDQVALQNKKAALPGCGGTHLVGFRLSLYDFLTNSNPHSLGHNLYIYGPYGPYGHTKKNTNELELPPKETVVDHHFPLI
jgi:hypothetical protein